MHFRSLVLFRLLQVIMATNKIEALDPALIRPGRIDRKIEFPLPDIKTKRRIFGIHTVKMHPRYFVLVVILCCHMTAYLYVERTFVLYHILMPTICACNRLERRIKVLSLYHCHPFVMTWGSGGTRYKYKNRLQVCFSFIRGAQAWYACLRSHVTKIIRAPDDCWYDYK